MAEFVEVIKTKDRMCRSLKHRCDDCPIQRYIDNPNYNCPVTPWHNSCESFLINYPQEAEEIIMEWAKANPAKTNAEIFKELFGVQIIKTPKNCGGIRCSELNCDTCKYNGFWDKEFILPWRNENEY